MQLELRRYARHAGDIADRLRQLDRMKDSFLANVSHELRTPLSSIRGYLEMLLEDDFDAETSQRFLSVMQRNSDRLLRLIDDLLTVARLSDDGARARPGRGRPGRARPPGHLRRAGRWPTTARSSCSDRTDEPGARPRRRASGSARRSTTWS